MGSSMVDVTLVAAVDEAVRVQPLALSSQPLEPSVPAVAQPVAAQPPKPRLPTPTARGRRLHVGHFAFMRAVVQGVEVAASWDRYLSIEGQASDARVVRATIAWIRDEFAAAAQRHARFGVARLVRLDAARLGAEADAKVPTLDEFAAAKGLEDFSQREQIAAFEAEYGDAARRARRRQRLIARQLEALAWLESLVAQPPQAGDGVAAWLNPTLAGHLHRADLFTLAQLVDRINGLGRRWFMTIKGLGPLKAERIVAWLRDHEDSIAASGGGRLGAHIERALTRLYRHELAAVVPPATDIRPLEKFIVPAALDGSRGLYRRPPEQCLLKASNDYQAVLAWLRSKQGLTLEKKQRLVAQRRQRGTGIEQPLDWLSSLSATQRAYRLEAERFLLWAIIERGKPLSSMSTEDCISYRDFLADPQPRSRWCAPRSRQRWSPLWRPFEGPLSLAAQRQAVKILANLYAFLVDQAYLIGNPWSAIAVPKRLGPDIHVGRAFTVAQWQFIERQVEMLPDTPINQRLAFALQLLYATGLRLSEAVAAKVDDLQWVEYPPEAGEGEGERGWILRVVGKGDKVREVPLPDPVVEQLQVYLASRGLAPALDDIGNQGVSLLGRTSSPVRGRLGLQAGLQNMADARAGVAARTLYGELRDFFRDCADVMRARGDAKGAARLAKASTHWLRHTHASHAIATGMPLDVLQQNLGHASLSTTTVYVTSESQRRMKAVREFWRKRSAPG
jgi:site-specific recombinase XerD